MSRQFSLMFAAVLVGLHVSAQPSWKGSLAQLAPFQDHKLDANMQRIIGLMDAFDADSTLNLIGRTLITLDTEKDVEPRYYLLGYRAEVLYYQGFYNDAVRDLATCSDLAEQLNDSLLRANVFNLQGLLQENIRHGDVAKEYFQKALAWYPEHPAARYPLSELFHIHGNYGYYLTEAGELDSAQYHLELSLQLASKVGASRAIAVAHEGLGLLDLKRALPDRALAEFQRAFQVSDTAHIPDVSLDVLMGIATAHAAMGDRLKTRKALASAENYLQLHHASVGLGAERDKAKSAYAVLRSIHDVQGALQAREQWAHMDSIINEGDLRAALSTQATLHRTDADLALERERSRLAAETMQRLQHDRNIVIAAALALLIFLSTLALFLQNKRKSDRKLASLRLAQAEQERTITELRIREQVGRDMHDDLGAGLSALKLRSEMALRVEEDPEKRTELQRLALTAGELIGSMRQIIWTMNSDQSSLEDLVVYTTNYVRNYMADHRITLVVNADGPWPAIDLSSEQRRNLFLVVKEATHNIIKHAHATRVELTINAKAGALAICITDNGVGLRADAQEGSGNGLRNMRKRIHELGGELTMESGNGTSFHFEIPLPATQVVPVT